MRKQLIALTLLITPLVGFAIERTLTLEPGSTLTVEGTSTVKSFKCTATRLDSDIAAEATSSLAGFVKRATVVIPVAQLDCANGTMNGHMRKALKADANPDIEFKLSSYDLSGQAATLKGTLTIAGQSKPVEILATVVEETDGAVRVKASTQIDMTQWEVKPPSLMMGTMKVRPNVTVSFDVSLKR